MNLLAETMEAIQKHGYEPDDIVFIGSLDGYGCTWSEFQDIANVDYDSGFGSSAVATDLIVLFSDGRYLERDEYDGSEWWSFSPPIEAPTDFQPIKRLVGAYWPSVNDLQDDSDDHHNPGLKETT